jgi:mannose-1-phosphate guanylyltransferase
MIKAVVIAGGSGSRLWPLSRAGYPKQFLPLTGEATLFQETVSRLDSLNVESLVAICNEDHRFFVAEQLREINKAGSIILEPFGKNTAPAIGLAALTSEDDSLLLVLPADHIVVDNDAFVAAVSGAIPLAESGKLVTFGIVAESPRTGYGYIRRGKEVNSGYVVDEFVEKPSAELAKEYVASGSYYWNSGMFLFKASRYLEELEKFRPDIYQACLASLASAESDSDFLRINSKEFAMCPSESIDYAVMEQTPDAVVVPLDAGWSDIGSWSSVWEMSDKDSDGNSSEGDILLHNTRNSLVRSDGRLVAAVGVDDLIIVCTKDAVMVSHRDSDQDVKVIVQKLKEQSRSEYELHREVHRPWGKYDSVDRGGRYQVKRITVSPGAKLSVQKHHHRAEHWVVVSGAAMVSNGDNVFLLSENESTYIAAGVIHSLENPGKVPLEIIEVQTGSYLGEDDIVRFDDLYGRMSK